jgi:hypothetical protein
MMLYGVVKGSVMVRLTRRLLREFCDEHLG